MATSFWDTTLGGMVLTHRDAQYSHGVIAMSRRYIAAVMLLLVGAVGCPAGGASEPERAEGLPGYYEFFMKAGKLTRIKDEAARDERIEAGELAPIRLTEPLPDLVLPLAGGGNLELASYRDRKHLVLVSFRSWW